MRLDYAPFLKLIGPEGEIPSEQVNGREAHGNRPFRLFVAVMTGRAPPDWHAPKPYGPHYGPHGATRA